MRVLFFTKVLTLVPFVEVVLELAEQGAEVVIALPTSERKRSLPEAVLGHPQIRLERYDEVEADGPARAAELLRRARDYVWYLRPEHAGAEFNRRRALDRLVEVALGRRHAPSKWRDPLLNLEAEPRASFEMLLAQLERRLDPDPGVVRFISSHDADVVLVTPLIRPGLHQTEVVKAARVLGVPTGFLVYSWDSLTNKGRLHAEPDRTFAWNDVHREEAVELHGVDPESVVVVGAAQWDAFFRLTPSLTRDGLCARHGFDPRRPVILYLGSTRTVTKNEPAVIDRWLGAVKASAGPAGDANVLVCPHPGLNGWEPGWADHVGSHPGVGVSDVSVKGGQGLYDDLCHADAVVALNTSAELEASILGKPVHTFAAGSLAPGQQGTLHFYNVLEDRGGFVRFAADLEEHVRDLERSLVGDVDHGAIRRFVESRVRPRGLDEPVSPILAAEIRRLAGSLPDPARREAILG
jgi:hypothetical protein